MNIKEVSKLTKLSVRTLQYYDKIGLLPTKRNVNNDYRKYENYHLDILQQILIYKELGFKLNEIKEILNTNNFDLEKALFNHKECITKEISRLNKLLTTITKTIDNKRGIIEMKSKEKFEGFDFKNNPYKEEAEKLYGEKVVNASNYYIKSLGLNGQEKLKKEFNNLFISLSKLKNEDPKSKTSIKAMEEMHSFFNKNFGYHYSLEAFKSLGQMYVEDERFKNNIDKFSLGLAKYLSQAMAHYVNIKLEK